MDEEKIKRLKEKIAKLRRLGREERAMNLERKLKNQSIRKNHKQTKTRTKTGNIVKAITKIAKEKVGLKTEVTPVKEEYMKDTNTGKKYHEDKTRKMIKKDR